MRLENIEKIGTEKGVKQIKLFTAFLSQRFPDESDNIKSYFEEWADRFNSGKPQIYMDSKSLKIFNDEKIKLRTTLEK